MTRRLRALPEALLLIAAGVACPLGCLITAFSLPIAPEPLVLLCCAAMFAAALAAVLFGWRGVLALVPVAAIGIYVIREPAAAAGRALLSTITTELSQYLQLTPLFPGAQAEAGQYTLLFAAVGAGLALLLALTAVLRKSVTLSALVTLPVALFAFAFVPLPPDMRWAVGLLGFYLAVRFARCLDPDRRARRVGTTALAVAVVCLVLAAAYLILPPAEYDGKPHAAALENRLKEVFPVLRPVIEGMADVGGLPPLPLDIWFVDRTRAGVADAGPLLLQNRRVLTVNTSQGGTYYLRGHSLETFDGRAWTAGTASLQPDPLDVAAAAQRPAVLLDRYNRDTRFPHEEVPLLRMIITNESDLSGLRYLPYYTHLGYSGSTSWVRDSYVTEQRDNYALHFYAAEQPLPALAAQLAQADAATTPPEQPSAPEQEPTSEGVPDDDVGVTIIYGDGTVITIEQDGTVSTYGRNPDGYVFSSQQMQVLAHNAYVNYVYTQIDPDTADALRALMRDAGIDGTADRQTAAQQVAAYVKRAARYTLIPPEIPADADFATYFLTESRAGYCIHFATAATLLLRSLGIPARFTTGFMVTVPDRMAGQDVSVTDGAAHAWVEVYHDDLGWLPIDVTPGTVGSADGFIGIDPDSPDPDDGDPDDPDPAPSADGTPGGPGGAPGTKPPAEPLPPVVYAILAAAALCAAAVLGRSAAARRRRRQFDQPDPNAAVLCIYRYTRRLVRRGGTVPAELEALALKARFSTHTLTRDERRAALQSAEHYAALADETRGFWSRMALRYILWLR